MKGACAADFSAVGPLSGAVHVHLKVKLREVCKNITPDAVRKAIEAQMPCLDE
jgi:hypothetical protein